MTTVFHFIHYVKAKFLVQSKFSVATNPLLKYCLAVVRAVKS